MKQTNKNRISISTVTVKEPPVTATLLADGEQQSVPSVRLPFKSDFIVLTAFPMQHFILQILCLVVVGLFYCVCF